MEHDSNTARAKLAKLLDDGSCAEAADLTASTILAEFVVIKRADLPEVVEEGGVLRVDGATYQANFATPAERRRRARHYLAVAEHLDAREAREAEAAKEATLTARRDALAAEVWKAGFGEGGGLRGYADLHPATKAAINWIMEAQDKLAEYEEVQA